MNSNFPNSKAQTEKEKFTVGLERNGVGKVSDEVRGRVCRVWKKWKGKGAESGEME